MGSTAQLIPPKMCAQFAERARNGEADKVGKDGSYYEFYQPTLNQVICLVSLDPPTGHVTKVTRQEMERLLKERGTK